MTDFLIADRRIAATARPYYIAEIGNNHDADLKQARELVSAAADSGADAVKFQTYTADSLVHPDHELYEFFSSYALPPEWHEELQAHAGNCGIQFLSTPFDVTAVDFLADLGVPALKISSSDLTNEPLIQQAVKTGLPLLMSTGMAHWQEIDAAMKWVSGKSMVAILHCVSVYPTKPEDAQLASIAEIAERYQVPVGFSDHSLTTSLPVAAIALGARIIEKHFTLDRGMPGPDHTVALQPEEFRRMVTEGNAVATAMQGNKAVTEPLEGVRTASLRGAYAAVDLPAGHVLGPDDLVFLRPTNEFSIDSFRSLVGRILAKDIKSRDALTKEVLE